MAVEKTDCRACPLRQVPVFLDFSETELAFMRRFKMGEEVVPPGGIVLSQGESSPLVYTVLEGFATRSVLLENGRRQVLNFVFPGDLIGLQAALMGEMQHTVQATTALRLCVFRRSRLWELFRDHPDRAFDLTWIGAVEEHFLGETIATLGQRDALQRMAWALARIWLRLSSLGLRADGYVPLPYRQSELADALGLSAVHTNRTLTALRGKGVITWSRQRLIVQDEKALLDLAGMTTTREVRRPLM
jgi:CRP/FNR family transcriptional regulator, anaerobic regulatory protein